MFTRKSFFTLAAGLAAVFLLAGGANIARAQALPPGVQDVVKLSQAGISDEVILTQIRNNAAIYNLTADQIILLKNQGVSQPVIKALMTGGAAAIPAPGPAPVALPSPMPGGPAVAPAAPAPAVSLEQVFNLQTRALRSLDSSAGLRPLLATDGRGQRSGLAAGF